MLTPAHVSFLLEFLKTKGVGFPIELCKVAGETLDILTEAQATKKTFVPVDSDGNPA